MQIPLQLPLDRIDLIELIEPTEPTEMVTLVITRTTRTAMVVVVEIRASIPRPRIEKTADTVVPRKVRAISGSFPVAAEAAAPATGRTSTPSTPIGTMCSLPPPHRTHHPQSHPPLMAIATAATLIITILQGATRTEVIVVEVEVVEVVVVVGPWHGLLPHLPLLLQSMMAIEETAKEEVTVIPTTTSLVDFPLIRRPITSSSISSSCHCRRLRCINRRKMFGLVGSNSSSLLPIKITSTTTAAVIVFPRGFPPMIPPQLLLQL